MKYTVDIQGMHCSGCTRLVAMSLSEQGLQDIRVDLATHCASFDSADGREAVQARIGSVAAELSDYRFGTVRDA